MPEPPIQQRGARNYPGMEMLSPDVHMHPSLLLTYPLKPLEGRHKLESLHPQEIYANSLVRGSMASLPLKSALFCSPVSY